MLNSIRRRTPIDHPFAVDGLMSLEPRQLLTVFTLVDTQDAFGLSDFVRSVVAPEADGAENFGYSVTALGDINNDGRPDFAVAAPGRLPDPIGRWGGPATDEGPIGRVYLFSGADLSIIRTLTDSTRGFGAAMANVGDMDGDGVADLVVGSPNFDNNADLAVDHHGRLAVYSGASGSVIRTIDGAGRFFELGYSLANVGDFDGDGHDDVIVGAPAAGADAAAEGPGGAFVYSLFDGDLLLTLTGENIGDRFGHAVAGGVDLQIALGNPDGVSDFVVGAPGYDGLGPDSGRAYAFSGQTGAQLINSPLGDGSPPATDGAIAGDIDPEAGDRFGSSVYIMGAGGDQSSTAFLLRVLVGAPGADRVAFEPLADPIADRGIVYAYSLGSGGVIVDANLAKKLDAATEGDRFGERMWALTDFVMVDGIPEFAIAAPGNITGNRLTIANGNFTNFTATGISSAGRYSSGAIVGDLDNDGINDFVFGEAAEDDRQNVAVRAQIVPFSIASGSLRVGAVSDDGNYIVLGASLGSTDGTGSVGYIIQNGRPITFREAGLEGLGVRAVNNAGLYFAERSFVEGVVVITEQYFVFQGVRTLLSQAISSTVGPAPTSELAFASMSNAGDVVFNAANGAYLFRAGRLIFLWEGRVGHVNDSGLVVGIGPETVAGLPQAGVLGLALVRVMTPSGVIHDLPEIYSTGSGRFVNNQGVVVGCRPSGSLVVAQLGPDGSRIGQGILPAEYAEYSALGLTGRFWNWTVTDVGENPNLQSFALEVNFGDLPPGRPTSAVGRASYYYEQRTLYSGLDPTYNGLRGTGEVIVNPLGVPLPPPSGSGSLIDRIISGNAILVSGRLGTPTPPVGAVDTAADHPINVTWTNRGLDVAVSATSGQGLVLRLTGQQAGLWLGSALPIASTGIFPPEILPEVTLYTDPREGRSYALVRFETTLVWFTQLFEGVYDAGRELPIAAPITSRLTIFTSTDNRVHVVGTSADGDVIMLFQTNQPLVGAAEVINWSSVNLSTEHLEPQGQATPNFVSDLTAYVAPWNGLNIAGIDDAGRIHTVWWAPGLTLWQTSNLSDIPAAANFVGNITSYVTPWSGLNVAGTTVDGQIATLWWVPEFGGAWRYNVLVPETPRGLAPGTLSAYVTPWGGLNIAGIDPETDQVAVYWWTPTTDWAFENLQVEGGSPVAEGRVTAIATPPGQLDIFARGSGDELYRFYWNPGDGSIWTVEDVGARTL